MKFAELLLSSMRPGWESHYIRYSTLSNICDKMRSDCSQEEKAHLSKEFRSICLADLESVSQFVRDQTYKLHQLQEALDHHHEKQQFSKRNEYWPNEETWATIDIGQQREILRALRLPWMGGIQAVDPLELERAMLKEEQQLRQLIDINMTACFKAGKKYDKCTGERWLTTLMKLVRSSPMSVSLHGLDFHRSAKMTPSAAAAAAAAANQDDFVDQDDLFLSVPEDVEMKSGGLKSKDVLRRRRRAARKRGRKAHKLMQSAANTLAASGMGRGNHEIDGVSVISGDDGTKSVKSGFARELKVLGDEALLRAKLNVYRKYLDQVTHEIALSFPEGGVALRDLSAAHQILFAPTGNEPDPADGSEDSDENENSSPSLFSSESARGRHFGSHPNNLNLAGGESVSSADSSMGDNVMAEFQSELSRIQSGTNKKPRVCCQPGELSWISSYNWRSNLRRDFIAAFTIAVYAIPQSLSYAVLVGLPPYFGLYTVIFPSLIYGLMGTSPHLAVGCLSIPALLTGSALTSLGLTYEENPTEYVEAMVIVTLMVAGWYMVVGSLRLGFIVDFVSQPVLNGFSSAAALITMVTVCKDMLGLSKVPKATTLIGSIQNIAPRFKDSHWQPLVVGFCALLIMVIFRKVKRIRNIPGALVAVVLSIVVVGAAGLDETVHVKTIGSLPLEVPSVIWISGSSWGNYLTQLIMPSFLIAVVALLETVAISQTMQMRYGYDKIRPSRDIVVLGIGNLVGALFRCFPTGGGFSRTSVNARAGAQTQASLAFSSIFVVALIAIAGKALALLPKAVLAAVVIFAMVGLIDVKMPYTLWHTDRFDLTVLLASFLGTCFLGVQLGVAAAVGLSLVIFLAIASRPSMQLMGRVPGTAVYQSLHANSVVIPARQVAIIGFGSSILFFNATRLKNFVRTVLRISDAAIANGASPDRQLKAVVLDLRACTRIDSVGRQALKSIHETCARKGVLLYLAALHHPLIEEVDEMLKRSMREQAGPDGLPAHMEPKVVPSTHNAVQQALRRIRSGRIDASGSLGALDVSDSEMVADEQVADLSSAGRRSDELPSHISDGEDRKESSKPISRKKSSIELSSYNKDERTLRQRSQGSDGSIRLLNSLTPK